MLLFIGCGGGFQDSPSPFLEEEQALQALLRKQTSTLTGKLLTHQGEPVANAALRFKQHETQSDASGTFQLTLTNSHHGLLEIHARGFHPEFIPLYMTSNPAQPTDINQTELAPIYLDPIHPHQARLLFAGDTGFGRRFIDTDESTPLNAIPDDDPNALIQTSNPEPGTRDALTWMRPFFQAADWAALNLESPVTDTPNTPHPTKAFVFFTLPNSLKALNWLGVDYVSLGNNHLYDYLEKGVTDTIKHLDQANIPHSGAGSNEQSAFAAFRVSIKGAPYAMLSANSVSGSRHAIDYNASAIKGGAADERNSAMITQRILEEKAAGFHPIYHLHTGKEYTLEPTAFTNTRFELAASAEPALVVAHHPHIAQGVGRSNGVVQIHSLGNFAFDQDRAETLLGQMARVDMTDGTVDRIRLHPVYLEDYRPRLIVGRLADQFLRRIGEYSHDYGGRVFPYLNQGWVTFTDHAIETIEREVRLTVDLNKNHEAIVDLRQIAEPLESLSQIQTNSNIQVQLGKDLMIHGDFEDNDTDDERLEAARWDVSGDSRFICQTHVFSGVSALCSTRSPKFIDDSVSAYRNRIRVLGDSIDEPNKDLSWIAYIKGINAGNIQLVARYYASEGDMAFGEETLVRVNPGTFDWQVFSGNLSMPKEQPITRVLGVNEKLGQFNARAVRLFLRHSPPERGEALAAFDDIAVISWQTQLTNSLDFIDTPHSNDFIKIHSNEKSVNLKLTFTRYSPRH
ncbi:MAG: CapA family protein [Cellvibrionales bacterium]|nr:CapA family protein [Cellvibrionales bacterium]